ncbi:hypothetical protein EB796_022597 [Bugula neritina]|uniref:Uncharacterized protein n=1 Tax=Bugula neritina TaxID=10212 RepID=A0A7J7IZ05_BUGNE|nr:hypothetical protein EB796_022597 [Bugula neritina]
MPVITSTKTLSRERQISPAKHLVLRSPSSSPSPTHLTSPRKHQVFGFMSSNARASTLPKSYRPTRNH